MLGELSVHDQGAIAYMLLVQLGRLALVSAILADGRVYDHPEWALARESASHGDQ